MKKELKAELLKRINMIWVKKQRVTHREFVRSLSKAPLSGGSVNIPKQTFSRLLHDFLQENGITKYITSELQTILDGAIREAINKGLNGPDELRRYVNNFLITRLRYSPSSSVLDRFFGNVAKDALRIYEAENNLLISNTIGKEISSLEFVKEFLSSSQYRRFPPVHEGKLGIKKLTSEYEIMLQIKDIFQTERIEFSGILRLPSIHFSKELVEKLHPSEAVWSSKELFAVHLQKYYAARYQDSIDAIVQCFIKAARLMRFRVNKSYNENSGKDSREFLEVVNAQFQEIYDAMKSGTIFVLEDYKEFFEMVAKKNRVLPQKGRLL